jgi:hypothetical protein
MEQDGAQSMEHLEQLGALLGAAWSTLEQLWSSDGALGALGALWSTWSTWSSYGALGAVLEHLWSTDGAPMEHLEQYGAPMEQLWSRWSTYGALGAAMEQLWSTMEQLWSTWSMEHLDSRRTRTAELLSM